MTALFAADGRERQPAETVAIAACHALVVEFCDLLDDGDLDAAFSLHADDLEFWEPGATEPTRGRAAARSGAEAFRHPYQGRRTLHVPSNFLSRIEPDGTIVMRYVVSVYELTEPVDGVARELPAPQLAALAQEHTTFRRDDGIWRIIEQRMGLIAPRGNV